MSILSFVIHARRLSDRDHVAEVSAIMITPCQDRFSSSPSKSLHTAHLRTVLLFVLAFLLVRGQFYIASTFAGTRPSRSTPPLASAFADAHALWQECSAVISSNLRDVGDAGRLWLRHAYVGSNPQSALPPDEPNDKYRCRCLSPDLHLAEKPRVTAIVQSFNHHYNIANISESLKSANTVDEIIVCEDGSTDGSLHDWRAVLPDDGHFIIRSNNLHELRSYNRAMRIASGDLIVLLQDNNRLPLSDEWVRNAQRLFEALPNLGVLGGHIGQIWNYDSGSSTEYGDWLGDSENSKSVESEGIPFIEPTTKLPFMYSECTWIAPFFIRRSILQKVGGLELAISKRGEPGVWLDCVFCYETWLNGYTVGTFFAPFEHGIDSLNTSSNIFKEKHRERVYERAVGHANRKFPRRRVSSAVKSLNSGTLNPRDT